MATYYARKAGNINASDVWATTPSGTAAAVTFAAGDVLMANSFAITVNVSTNLGATGEVRTDTTGGATAGGSFALSNGVTLTANCIAGTTACVTFSGAAGNSATIVGNVTGGPGTAAHGAINNSTGTLNVTGIVTGGSSASGAFGASNSVNGTLNITGSVFGGPNSACHGANNQQTGVLNITGGVTATAGVGANQISTGTLLIEGTLQASEDNHAISGTNRAQVTLLTGPFLISPTFGVNPIGSRSWRWASALNNQTYLEVGTQTLLQKRNLVTPDNATNFPSASDVRSGTAYGIGGVVTGTCVVPSPSVVAAGSPVDNTVGTLVSPSAEDIATAVWGAASRTITGGTVDTLTNAPASVTPSDIWSYNARTLTSASGPTAVQIRQEMDANSTKLANLDAPVSGATAPSAATVATAVRTALSVELARVDAAVSSRATAANIPSADITAIKAKTDALDTARLAQVSTVPITGAQLAAALS